MTTHHNQVESVEQRLAKFREGIKYTGAVGFRLGTVNFRILTRAEEMDIRRKAIAEAMKYGGDETEKNNFIQMSTLQLASTGPDKIPHLPLPLLNQLTSDELKFLYEEYVKIMDDANPSMERIETGEFQALVNAVKKNAVGSRDLSLRQLRGIFLAFQDLIQRMDAQIQQTDNTSGGQ